MEEKKFTTVKPEDLTVQDRWDILLEYTDFSAKLFMLQLFAQSDPKEREKYAVASSALLAIKKIMTSDENLIQALHEMSRGGMSDLIRSIPLPPNFEGK